MTAPATPKTPEILSTVEIPEWALGIVQERMTKIARRAKRLGKVAPTAEVLERFTRDEVVKGRVATNYYARLAVSGERPVITGWELIGGVTHVTKDATVLRSAPGHELPESYRTRGNLCDHCGTERRRKDTFVLRAEDGKELQVGRNCLADFLGSETDAKDLVALWSIFTEIDSIGDYDEDGPRGSRWGFGLLEYLAWSAMVCRVDGWVSRGKARDQGCAATADTACEWGIMLPAEREEKKIPEPGAEDHKAAKAALAWILELPASERSFGYLANLHAACQALVVDSKLMGLVASLVGAAHPNAMGRIEKLKREVELRAGRKPSEHVGEIKERLVRTVTVRRVRGWEGTYGYTTLVSMETAEGDALVWFASGDRLDDFGEGDVLEVKATIKAHNVSKYSKEPETTVSRLVVVSVVSRAEEAA